MQSSLDQKNYNYFIVAKTVHGLEDVLAKEVKAIGGTSIRTVKRGVTYQGTLETVYRSNLWLRTAIRVLVMIKKFEVKDANDLYFNMSKIEWDRLYDVDCTIKVDSVTHSDAFVHSRFASQKAKDAIVDYFRDKYGRRPSVSLDAPDVVIHVHIVNQSASIYLDSSGDALFKRGYRQKQFDAPLNEVIAAGLIKLTGWDGKTAFVDPMCGSGTFTIEAALIAQNIAPGLIRKAFSFQNWKNFQSEMWDNLVKDAENSKTKSNCRFYCSDISSDSLAHARDNIESAGIDADDIYLKKSDIQNLQIKEEGGVALLNPPYDERLRADNVEQLYSEIGDAMKQRFAGFEVWILSANFKALKRIGLHKTSNITVYNGGLESRFQQFSIYSGSKKSKYNENL